MRAAVWLGSARRSAAAGRNTGKVTRLGHFASPQKIRKYCVRPGGSILLHPQIFRRLFAPVRDDVERDLVALAHFTQPGPLDRGDVNEHVLASTAVRLDEA